MVLSVLCEEFDILTTFCIIVHVMIHNVFCSGCQKWEGRFFMYSGKPGSPTAGSPLRCKCYMTLVGKIASSTPMASAPRIAPRMVTLILGTTNWAA